MTRRQIKDVAASVRQRLLNLAHQNGEDFQLVLTRYGLERLLYRLSQSAHSERFLLKGAMLFSVWADAPHRSTRDLDLLGRGDNTVATQEQIFTEVCETPVEDDGLAFDTGSIRGEELHEEQEYPGVRVVFGASLAGARIPIQVDVGFGDVISLQPDAIEYPTLLDLPAPRLLAYPREVVVAEKFQAMVVLGMGNSRMKDFYDLAVLGQQYAFDGERVTRAMESTFARRGTNLPKEPPLALSPEFSHDSEKKRQWEAFLRRSRLEGVEVDLAGVVELLSAFLMPPSLALAEHQPFKMRWPTGGPWRQSEGPRS